MGLAVDHHEAGRGADRSTAAVPALGRSIGCADVAQQRLLPAIDQGLRPVVPVTVGGGAIEAPTVGPIGPFGGPVRVREPIAMAEVDDDVRAAHGVQDAGPGCARGVGLDDGGAGCLGGGSDLVATGAVVVGQGADRADDDGDLDAGGGGGLRRGGGRSGRGDGHQAGGQHDASQSVVQYAVPVWIARSDRRDRNPSPVGRPMAGWSRNRRSL